MIDAKARRLERDARDLRRLAAQLRDTVAESDTEREDTEHGIPQACAA